MRRDAIAEDFPQLRDFRRLPPDPGALPVLYVPGPASPRFTPLAEIVKIGLPGTDMPGHECLPDTQVAAIAK